MTPPTPAVYSNGCCPLSLVDQNFLSVSITVPVACTLTLLFLATTLSPAPSVTTLYVVLTPGIACDGIKRQDQPICRSRASQVRRALTRDLHARCAQGERGAEQQAKIACHAGREKPRVLTAGFAALLYGLLFVFFFSFPPPVLFVSAAFFVSLCLRHFLFVSADLLFVSAAFSTLHPGEHAAGGIEN